MAAARQFDSVPLNPGQHDASDMLPYRPRPARPRATLKTGVVRRILAGRFELPPEPDLTVHARLGIAKENLMIFYPGNIHPANVTEVESLYLALDLVAASGSMVSFLC